MMNTDWKMDYLRFRKQPDRFLKKYLRIRKNPGLRYMFLYRKAGNSRNRIARAYYRWRLYRLQMKCHVEINTDRLGGGCLLVHPYNITINGNAEIGKNFTIFKGATVGSIRNGKRKGAPVIGDRVTVCPGAMVCGGITIGDDVLIAANAFVDFDVPSNSLVFGNPGVIKPKANASADYL